ncbi:MAG TPA: hypothetical protein VHJ38_07635 [Nitrososphaeraceae archaeon]|nr:hypothetical protein [Nitrososphaeraceae archaeon]
MINYDKLSKKTRVLFRSFTRLILPGFNSFVEIESKYAKNEIKRISKRKERNQSTRARRHFNTQ